MKIGDSIVLITIGIFLGMIVHACTSPENQHNEISCNPIEEARLEIALRECSDAVMGYAWGEIEQ